MGRRDMKHRLPGTWEFVSIWESLKPFFCLGNTGTAVLTGGGPQMTDQNKSDDTSPKIIEDIRARYRELYDLDLSHEELCAALEDMRRDSLKEFAKLWLRGTTSLGQMDKLIAYCRGKNGAEHEKPTGTETEGPGGTSGAGGTETG